MKMNINLLKVNHTLDEVINLVHIEIRYKKKEIIETIYHYSYYIIALVIVIFSYWIYKNCKNNNRNNMHVVERS